MGHLEDDDLPLRRAAVSGMRWRVLDDARRTVAVVTATATLERWMKKAADRERRWVGRQCQARS